jgi:hypothetical protein
MPRGQGVDADKENLIRSGANLSALPHPPKARDSGLVSKRPLQSQILIRGMCRAVQCDEGGFFCFRLSCQRQLGGLLKSRYM